MPNATSPIRPDGTPVPRGRAESRSIADRVAQRNAWMDEIAPTSHFHALFDCLPGLHFFAKNRAGELMFLSRSIRERYGIGRDEDVIGLTDFDINPDGMAQSYVGDDERIYATGEPIVGRVELWWDLQGVPDWFLVTKAPIRSRTSEIIGVMGVSQDCPDRDRLAAPWSEIADVVRKIREGFPEQIDLSMLARQAGLSLRQLQRKFRAVLGITPQDFLIKTRVLAAGRALRQSDASLAMIATDCGFYDQSSFTEQFHRHLGKTPREFRKANQIGAAFRR